MRPGLTPRTGTWLAWLLLDEHEPDDCMPPRWELTWNTRRVQHEQVDYYWSEPGRAGVLPCVEAWLHRLHVTRRLGEPFDLWRTQITAQVPVAGQAVNLERRRSFSTGFQAEARAEFAMAAHVRRSLGRQTRPFHEWREFDRLLGEARE